MDRDGFVRQSTHEIGLPIPLLARRIETVVHTLEYRIWNRADHVERWGLEAPDRLENFLRFLDRSGVAPHDAAHLLIVQTLGERSRGRHGEEGKEAVEVIGRLRDEFAVPA